MNILFVTDLYPVNDDDNSPNILKKICESFIESGHNVRVIRPNFLLNSFLRGKKFFTTGYYQNLYNVNYFTPFLFNVFNKLVDIREFDLIVSHMPSGSIFAQKLLEKDNKRLICGVHNSDLKVLTQSIYSFYFRSKLLNAFRKAEKLVCRSYIVEKKLLKLYPEFLGKTVVLPYGIDEKLIIKKNPQFGEKIKVLTCGNFIKRKNIDKVIEALKDEKDVELTCVGGGNLLNKMKRLNKTVRFTGKLSNDKVLSLMRQSDIFILPSVDETLGIVYLEAMASGCITVGTINEGIDGIIKNGENGFLIEPTVQDIKDVIYKIKNLDKNELNKISQICYNSIKRYVLQGCSDKYFD